MISRDVLQKKFRIFILLSLFILIIEIAGGIFTNSLALLSDAGHVFVDLLAILLAYAALGISQKKPTNKFTYGYRRAEILAAVINGIILIFITIFIFYESYVRFLSSETIKGPEMLVISVIGLMGNLYVVLKMKDYEKENLNIKGAYLHVLTDALSSFGVVIAGILIITTGNYIFDPIMSVIIGFFILMSSLRLIYECVNILMEATPHCIDIEKLLKDIQKIKGVKEVHDLHVWSTSSDIHNMSSHVLIDAKDVKSMQKTVSNVKKMLASKYNIMHTVIQSECEKCIDSKKHNRH